MQATALAHPNIALVKYWGKADRALNLPAVGSISITLDTLTTTTTVRFEPGLAADRLLLNGVPAPERERARVGAVLDLLRERAGRGTYAEVESANSFPTAAGLASSASGFAALVVAADRALGANLGPAVLSELARRGSGSAARSLHGGFVELERTPDGTSTRTLLAPRDWPLRVVVAVVSSRPKPVGSTDGMIHSERTSPFYPAWVEGADGDLGTAREAIAGRDFDALARVAEHSCLKMHAVILASDPGVMYWTGTTIECVHRVRELRREGAAVFLTIDAGPQVKAVCLPADEARVAAALTEVPGVVEVLRCGLGEGARVVA